MVCIAQYSRVRRSVPRDQSAVGPGSLEKFRSILSTSNSIIESPIGKSNDEGITNPILSQCNYLNASFQLRGMMIDKRMRVRVLWMCNNARTARVGAFLSSHYFLPLLLCRRCCCCSLSSRASYPAGRWRLPLKTARRVLRCGGAFIRNASSARVPFRNLQCPFVFFFLIHLVIRCLWSYIYIYIYILVFINLPLVIFSRLKQFTCNNLRMDVLRILIYATPFPVSFSYKWRHKHMHACRHGHVCIYILIEKIYQYVHANLTSVLLWR